MVTGVEEAPPVPSALVRPVTLAWFLKRSLIGITILIVAMGGLAWLTYASIDPDLDGETGQKTVKTVREAPPAVRSSAIDL